MEDQPIQSEDRRQILSGEGFNRFSPEQRIQHYELEGAKGKAGVKNGSVQAATSSNSDTEGDGESFGQNARNKKQKWNPSRGPKLASGCRHYIMDVKSGG